jgi:phasin family protein
VTHQPQEQNMANETNKAGGGTSFSDAMHQAKAASDQITRMFSEMKLPVVPDMEALLIAYKRNMDTLSAANRIALEGAQAVAKRHMEIMQQAMAELSESMRAMATASETPQAKAARQAEFLKRAYKRAVSNSHELSELIQHSNGEALELLNKRFVEAMDEVKALVGKAGLHEP